jgi:hypothetical protein
MKKFSGLLKKLLVIIRFERKKEAWTNLYLQRHGVKVLKK